MKKLCWAMLVLVSLALPALAETYYIDNPSLICKAHFKTSFNEFVTQDGDGFILEFDEKQYQSKTGLLSKFRRGFRYNGVIEGTNAAMLLNWPKDSKKGILTVLSAEYPCRASYGKEQQIQTANFDEASKLPAEEEPAVNEVDASFSDNSILRSEVSSMVTLDGSQSPSADLQPQKPSSTGPQIELETGPSVTVQSQSLQSSNSSQISAPSMMQLRTNRWK